jgi:hypothetical protein
VTDDPAWMWMWMLLSYRSSVRSDGDQTEAEFSSAWSRGTSIPELSKVTWISLEGGRPDGGRRYGRERDNTFDCSLQDCLNSTKKFNYISERVIGWEPTIKSLSEPTCRLRTHD